MRSVQMSCQPESRELQNFPWATGVGITLRHNVGFATLNPTEVLSLDTANGVLMASLEIRE
jgi:hypothetical protein